MSEIIEKIKEELETNSSEEQIISRINELIKEYNAHISIKSISEMYGKEFIIPAYQRGYRWKKIHVTKMLKDLKTFFDKEKESLKGYCLQPVIVKKVGNAYEIIDGQQRLTTMLLILKSIFSDDENCRYKFNFQTRENNNIEEFLNSSSEVELYKDTIDEYYLQNAKEEIKKFFQKNEKLRKEDIERIKILWYEIKSEDKEWEDPNAVFARINAGKIPLTNAELSKALLLKLTNIKDYKDFEFVQKENSKTWDEIENLFENDEFWYFIMNKNIPQYNKTRIDLLFDIYAERINSKNIFDYIEEEINNDEDKKTKIWNDLKEIYFYLKEWYEDIEIYHLIGYKIYFELKNYKNNVAYIIADLIKKYREKDKDEFKKYLYETIFISLYNNYKEAYKPKNKENKFIWLDDIEYDPDINNNNDIIRKMLLLFNLVSMTKINKRISFKEIKNEKWNIEHVYPVHDGLEDKDNRKELNKQILIHVTKYKMINAGIEEYKGNFTKLDESIDKLNNLEEKDYNDEEYRKILEDVNKILFVVSPKEENRSKLGNLVLLNESINKSYQNDFFVDKRKVIIEKIVKGKNNKNEQIKYILPCTERVFLKFYSDDILQTERWDDKDCEKYLNAIKKELNKAFGEIKRGGFRRFRKIKNKRGEIKR